MSYELKIDPKKRAGSRFIGKVRKELALAVLEEKALTGVNQQKLAVALGVHRSVISRMLKGEANLTLRSLGEMGWALGWDVNFTMTRKIQPSQPNNLYSEKPVAQPVSVGATKQNVMFYTQQPLDYGAKAPLLEHAL